MVQLSQRIKCRVLFSGEFADTDGMSVPKIQVHVAWQVFVLLLRAIAHTLGRLLELDDLLRNKDDANPTDLQPK